MKICHITSVHSRYDTRIFYKECVSLAKAGYDVTFLIAERGKTKPEIRDGVSIVPVEFNPRNRIDRIINSPRVLLKKALETNAEIYHLHDPELLPLAKKLKKSGKKVIFDSHEDVGGQILGKEWIPSFLRPSVSYLYNVYSNRVLTEMDYLIGVTPHLTEKLREINANTEMITNFPVLNPDATFAKETNSSCKNSFCFAGGISEQWNHETILAALEAIDASYILMGRATEEYLLKLKSFKSWGQVIYHGVIPHEQVGAILPTCAAGLAIVDYSDNSFGKIGTLGNTKFFEYMQAGIPVICTDFLLWEKIIEKWDCGICIPPRDPVSLREAIRFLSDNPDRAKEMGANGRRAILEEFNWGIEEKKLLALYRKISFLSD